jgi:hypothetical protein
LQQVLASQVQGRQEHAPEDGWEDGGSFGEASPVPPSPAAPSAAAGQPAAQPTGQPPAAQHPPPHLQEIHSAVPAPAAALGATPSAARGVAHQQPAQPSSPSGPTASRLWGGQQAPAQPADADPLPPPKPASRTASDILAAYRARQQHAASEAAAAAQPAHSSGTPSREASAGELKAAEARSSSDSLDWGKPHSQPQKAGPVAAENGLAATVQAAVQGGGNGEDYCVSDFTSEDSGRF